MNFSPFSLKDAINASQTSQFNKLKLAVMQDEVDTKKRLRDIASQSTVPTYGQAEGPPTQAGAKPQIQTGTEYSSKAHAQKLGGAGEIDAMAKLQNVRNSMQENEQKELDQTILSAAQIAFTADTPEKWVSEQQGGNIPQDQPFERREFAINAGRKIEDLINPRSQGRGGYTTLVDVVLTNEDGTKSTYKVPFDHRGDGYKWDEKILLSPKDPSQQGAVAKAKKTGIVEGEERTKAKIDLPKVKSNAKYLKSIVRKITTHAGFETVVGAPSPGKLTQFIPGTEAADFRVLQKQLEGKQFSQAYETLKGGGQITELEGEKATSALSRMKTASSEDAYREAAEEFITEIERLTDLAEQRASGKKAVTKDGWSIKEL